MDADKVLEHLVRELQGEIAAKSTVVANGGVHSFEEYKFVCGQIRGLLLAKETVESLLQRVLDNDE